MLKKIWKDPVWSKVISVIIIGILSLIYAKIQSVISEITFKEALFNLINIKIKLIYILVLLFLYVIIRMIFKKKKSYYSPKQQRLREFNKIEDPQNGILFKWGVYFDYGQNPFISDLTAFCTKHGNTPLRFINNRCPFQGCDNSRNSIDIYSAKNYIESELIAKWDEIK